MTVPAMVVPEAFAESCSRFGRLVGFLDGNEARALSHAELEEWLACDGRDLLRQLLQDHLDLRATRELPSKPVTNAPWSACSVR